MKFGSFLPTGKKFFNFFWGGGWGGTVLENRIQFWPKLSVALHYHKMKLLSNFFIQTIYLSDKTNQEKLKFGPFLSAWNELIKLFGGWFRKQDSVFTYTCMALQCHKIKLLWRSFCSGNLLFGQNKEIQSDIWALFIRSEETEKFLGCLFEKQHLVLVQIVHGASVSRNKILAKIFGTSNLPFWQRKAMKYEIWTLFACWKEIEQFLLCWFGKQNSVLAQSLHASSVSQNKTPVKVVWFK